MSANKARGTRWEKAVVDYLVAAGWPHAERRALHGAEDKGDVVGIPGVVIECKSQARHSLAEWLDEAEVERDNANAGLGVVWFKRRGRTSAASGYSADGWWHLHQTPARGRLVTCNAYPACPCEGFDYTRTAPGGFRMCECSHTEQNHQKEAGR